jgi:hypothetical protein
MACENCVDLNTKVKIDPTLPVVPCSLGSGPLGQNFDLRYPEAVQGGRGKHGHNPLAHRQFW